MLEERQKRGGCTTTPRARPGLCMHPGPPCCMGLDGKSGAKNEELNLVLWHWPGWSREEAPGRSHPLPSRCPQAPSLQLGGNLGTQRGILRLWVNLSSVLSRPQPGVLFATASRVLIFYTSHSASPTWDPIQFWQREPSTGGKDQTQQLNHQKKQTTKTTLDLKERFPRAEPTLPPPRGWVPHADTRGS